MKHFSEEKIPSRSYANVKEIKLDAPRAYARAKQSTASEQESSPEDDPRFKSVVIVRNPKGSIGSGFFISSDKILANHHVVENVNYAEIKLWMDVRQWGKSSNQIQLWI